MNAYVLQCSAQVMQQHFPLIGLLWTYCCIDSHFLLAIMPFSQKQIYVIGVTGMRFLFSYRPTRTFMEMEWLWASNFQMDNKATGVSMPVVPVSENICCMYMYCLHCCLQDAWQHEWNTESRTLLILWFLVFRMAPCGREVGGVNEELAAGQNTPILQRFFSLI